MPSITVPKEFFVKERRMYTNWLQAFWREFFQNSVDAGSKRIDVRIQAIDTGQVEIVFTDDGCGMTREVLENVYFRLGASTKSSDDMVGGFGRARILTCFSMDSYTIRTLNNRVVGTGGEYEIVECEPIEGTEVRVLLSDEAMYRIEYALSDYLSLCQMGCEVWVNGLRHTQWLYRREIARTLDLDGVAFANVHVNKSARSSTLAVRVAGALMYHRYVNVNAQVIVEILPSMSRSVLMANRDSMQQSYEKVLEQFIGELATETLSALKPRFQRKTASFRGTGLFLNLGKNALQAQRKLAADAALAPAGETQQVTIENKSTIERLRSQTSTASAIDRLGVARVTTSETHGGRYLPALPNIYLLDETDTPAVRRVIDNYDPNNWITIYHRGKPMNRGSTIYKVLMMWKIACDAAVEALLVSNDSISSMTWGIGWIFSETALAKHMRVEGGSVFLLNPVNQEGNLRYFLTEQESQKRMMAFAKHEVAHSVEVIHNETFAQTLTMIDANYDEREVYKRLRMLTR